MRLPGTQALRAALRAGLGMSKEAFGKMPDGTAVEKYILSNTHGITVSILAYGGIVQTIYVPDKNGKLANVSLCFDKLEDYIKSSPYFGASMMSLCLSLALGWPAGSGLAVPIFSV